MFEFYRRVVLEHPLIIILAVLILTGLASTQIENTRLDISSDSLLLRDDPDLEFFRELNAHYDLSDFLVLTWKPKAPLLDDASLLPLAGMVAELRALPKVSSVASVLDVPLLESPPLLLSDLADADNLPTLSDLDVDRELALKELTTSPIYSGLLADVAGSVTAVEVNIHTSPEQGALFNERESLRKLEATGDISVIQRERLYQVEADYDGIQLIENQHRSDLVKNIRDIASRYRDSAEIFLGGVPMITADMISFVRSDLIVFGGAIIGIMVLVLAFVFRDWRWVFAPILNCAVIASITLGLLAWLDWRMTVISSNFVAVLLIITLSLSVHLIVRYRELEQTNPDMDKLKRAIDTMRLMVVPCFYTTITSIVAFASLLIAGVQPVIDFGLMMTVGIVISFTITFLLIPSLIVLLPESSRGRSTMKENVTIIRHFSIYVEHYGGVIIGVAVVLLLASAVGISLLKVENRFIDYFKESTEIYQGMELLDTRLGGTIPLDIILYPPTEARAPADMLSEHATNTDAGYEEADLSSGGDFFTDDPFAKDFLGSDSFGGVASSEDAASRKSSYWFTPQGRRLLDRAHDIVNARPETGKVLSLSTAFDVMDGLYGRTLGAVELALVENNLPENVKNRLITPYFNSGLNETRISVRVMESNKELRRDKFLKELRTTLIDELDIEPEQVRFTSLLVLYNNVLQSLFHSQILTIGVVFLAIGGMFWVLFKSLSMALLCLAPNVLAAGIVLGVMGLSGIPLDIMTVTIAAIVVGIGVDDCIHYIHRFQSEFAKSKDYHVAMRRSHDSIGRAMYYTTVTIMVGFSLLTVSHFTPSFYFGVLTDVAMIAAVMGALLLLPKLILIFKPFGPDGGVGYK